MRLVLCPRPKGQGNFKNKEQKVKARASTYPILISPIKDRQLRQATAGARCSKCPTYHYKNNFTKKREQNGATSRQGGITIPKGYRPRACKQTVPYDIKKIG